MLSLSNTNNDSFEVPKHQHKKAAKGKAEAAKPEEPVPTGPTRPIEEAQRLPVINGKVVDTNRDGWQFKLTLAEMREFKAQKAIAKHNELHHPKYKSEPVRNHSGTRPEAKKSGNTSASSFRAQPVLNNATNGSDRSDQNVDAGIGFGRQQIAPCGIPNCPVFAQHESRIYAYKDPRWIMAVQGKSNKAALAEREKVEAFFNLHRVFSAQANKERGEARSRT